MIINYRTPRPNWSWGIFLPGGGGGFPGFWILERKDAEVRKATTPLLLHGSLFFAWAAVSPFEVQSCRSSQSDHSVTSATRFEFFDSQMQGTRTNFHAPGILQPPWTEWRCRGRWRHKTCKQIHLQTNIEARLRDAEPRKKKHNYSLVSLNVLIFGTIQS